MLGSDVDDQLVFVVGTVEPLGNELCVDALFVELLVKKAQQLGSVSSEAIKMGRYYDVEPMILGILT